MTAKAVLLAGLAAICLTACERGGGEAQSQTAAPIAAWRQTDVVLYLPSKVMEQRVAIGDLSPYLDSVNAEAAAVFASQEPQPGATGAVLVMVQPAGRSRAWVVTGEPALAAEVAQSVIQRVQALAPPPVTGGPILVGIQFEVWGGGEEPVGAKPPIPREWYGYFSKEGGLLDDAFMARVWSE